MIIKWSAKFSAMTVGIVLLTMFSACSSQQGSSPSGGTQVASANPTEKCDLNVKRICQEMRNRNDIVGADGLTQGARQIEGNSTRTAQEFMTYQVPAGSTIQVSCDINAEHQTVVYAHLMPGTPMTPTDVAYFRNAGYCGQ